MRQKARKRGATALAWNPTVLKHDVFAGVAVLVICLFAGAGLLDRYLEESGSPYIAAVLSAVLVDLANEDREELALVDLQVDAKLTAAAQEKADDMAAKGYFAHETPEGYDSWHWFRNVGYDYQYAGENLAVDFSESADVQKAWMASPTHRANIVNERYTEIGIATAVGKYKGHNAIFAVQMFGRPSAAELRSRASAAAATAAVPGPSISIASQSGATLGEATEALAPAESGVTEESRDMMIVKPEDIPWWAYFVAQPKEMLRIAYYVIGLALLAGLFFDMELELKWHHLRHARKVGYMLATMSMLFIAADWAFFAEPTLAAIGALMP